MYFHPTQFPTKRETRQNCYINHTIILAFLNSNIYFTAANHFQKNKSRNLKLTVCDVFVPNEAALPSGFCFYCTAASAKAFCTDALLFTDSSGCGAASLLNKFRALKLNYLYFVQVKPSRWRKGQKRFCEQCAIIKIMIPGGFCQMRSEYYLTIVYFVIEESTFSYLHKNKKCCSTNSKDLCLFNAQHFFNLLVFNSHVDKTFLLNYF